MLQACCYFCSKYSNELHLLIPPVRTFTSRTWIATSIEWNSLHSFCVPNVKWNFHPDSFPPTKTPTWMLPWKLKSWHLQVKALLSYLLVILISYYLLLHSPHFCWLYIEWLSSLVLGEILVKKKKKGGGSTIRLLWREKCRYAQRIHPMFEQLQFFFLLITDTKDNGRKAL